MSVSESLDVGQESGVGSTAPDAPAPTSPASGYVRFDDDMASRNPFAREQQPTAEPAVEPGVEPAVSPAVEPARERVGEPMVDSVLEESFGDGWTTPAPAVSSDDSLADPHALESFHNAWTDLRLAAAASSSPNERQLKEAADDLKQREHAAVFRQLRAQGIARGTGWR